MRSKVISLLLIAIMFLLYMPAGVVQAQDAIPSELPAPNAVVTYDRGSVYLTNISAERISIDSLVFWRAGGSAQYDMSSIRVSLEPGHCIQIRTPEASAIGQPVECAALDNWISSSRGDVAFWRGDYEDEPFRPQFNGRTLTICNTSAGRCEFHIPQGENAQRQWVVYDPQTGFPMPAGLQVAYDANQMWIGNFTPGTVLQTRGDLRIAYLNAEGNPIGLWTPSTGPWDEPEWNNRGLFPGECIVLYGDKSLVKPLLPCKPVAHSQQAAQQWVTRFWVIGPREERPTVCGTNTPVSAPAICLVWG